MSTIRGNDALIKEYCQTARLISKQSLGKSVSKWHILYHCFIARVETKHDHLQPSWVQSPDSNTDSEIWGYCLHVN